MSRDSSSEDVYERGGKGGWRREIGWKVEGGMIVGGEGSRGEGVTGVSVLCTSGGPQDVQECKLGGPQAAQAPQGQPVYSQAPAPTQTRTHTHTQAQTQTQTQTQAQVKTQTDTPDAAPEIAAAVDEEEGRRRGGRRLVCGGTLETKQSGSPGLHGDQKESGGNPHSCQHPYSNTPSALAPVLIHALLPGR